MSESAQHEASVAGYELEVEIAGPPDRVWRAIFEDINAWWLPDFHMIGPGSVVQFEARAGGGLVEELEGAGSLLWCTVHWIRPAERVVYLVGHLAPDWGGPACSHLKFAVESRGQGSVLKVTDSHFGHISQSNLASLQEGWNCLFRDGLKRFIECGVRHDGAQ